ncbi:MAG TPA: hypothetical protein VHQ42_02350 [Candidatus Limnocylindria bacterium]|nr:hypothetical protein [Candidatus Limnocylindria bacterium]
MTRRWPLAALTLLLLFATSFTVVRANVLGMGERWDRLTSRIETFLDPPPQRSTIPTVVVTPAPSATSAPTAAPTLPPSATPSPSPTPLLRAPVDVAVVDDHAAVFASQITKDDCAVAATQMVLTILGLGNTSDAFQAEIKGRIGEWESWEDSHNGGWGPAAVALALKAYGEPDYRLFAYDSYADALRDSAIAISETDKPVVMFPWWGAHTWVMTGYRADADPTLFDDAAISGAYILDPWYPRISSIWGPSDPPGNFEGLAELERNWPAYQGPPGYESIGPGWTRPEGAYPDRDGKFVVLLPTAPRGG